MTSAQQNITIACILSNLLVGNLIIYLGGRSSFGGTPNYWLMGALSVVCVFTYLLLFNKVNFAGWNKVGLALFSVGVCMGIIVLGCMLTGVLIDSSTWKTVYDGFLSLLVGLVLGIIGSIGMFFIAAGMGLMNFLWTLLFLKYK